MRPRSPNSTSTKQPHAANRRTDAPPLPAEEHAFRPKLIEAAKEGRTPRPHGERGAEEDHRVNTQPAGAGPVGIRLEVEPQRKFVEGERGAHAIADSHQ